MKTVTIFEKETFITPVVNTGAIIKKYNLPANSKVTGKVLSEKLIELQVKDSVWCVYNETKTEISEEFYAHADVLERGFDFDELNFVESYKDRYICLNKGLDYFVYDNKEKNIFQFPKSYYSNYITFKIFKRNLQLLKLI